MKKYIVIIPLFMLLISAWGQTHPVRVVFDVTSGDESTHQTVMRHVKLMAEAYKDSEFEVVIYGGALPMALREQSSVSADIAAFQDSDRVSILVCEETMRRYHAEPSQLLTGIRTVPDGLLEIVLRQGEGWGYIKESHK
ncbi:DsrE family protein [Negadavirga shengliensis]|uniref:DsrE family protein n=1 Tax=Negadavirga shengliensis TaxID=1389218 RepID=A0ABV9T6Z1_9BACT